ncbi:MAG: hypothetical protein H6684_01550 [Deltaproteobacteria bacterium]|nr:hypothetical protein [bacterium]MCB9487397.1 hypothetical protein [Deltaproteobacteria bacterium]
MQGRIMAFIVAAVLAISTSAWAGSMTIDPTHPKVGEAATITVTLDEDPGPVSLSVTYRPNSRTEHSVKESAFTPTDGLTRSMQWTPSDAGITALAVVPEGEDAKAVASTTVATRFSGIPISGVFIFLFAGVVLFGGMAWSIRIVMQHDLATQTGTDHVLADD